MSKNCMHEMVLTFVSVKDFEPQQKGRVMLFVNNMSL